MHCDAILVLIPLSLIIGIPLWLAVLHRATYGRW